MTTSTSTIIETININYNDFNESFLTCATCLYPFDTDSHRPKLLSCSHTVCKTCLERIAELPQSQDTGSFRCPICRETIPVPRSGVQSLPPSFVINQLIDLMSRQRRDLVPKCATHPNEELLFCETCDIVFCSSCSSSTTSSSTVSPLAFSSSLILPPADPTPSNIAAGGSLNLCSTSSSQLTQNANDLGSFSTPSCQTTSTTNTNSNPRYHQASQCLNHTVVPFSIAIKRMSEILLYKATQCTKNLNKAAENVRKEMDMLDLNADKVVDQVNSSFQDLNKCVERRRQELIDSIRRTRDCKRKILQEQLGIIHSEKAKVEQECSTLHAQLLDVRHISRRVNELNQKLDASSHLIEPRENSFLRYDADSSGFVMDGLQKVLSEFGTLCISKTFPPLCTARYSTPTVLNVKCSVSLTTVDYDGQSRVSGGDPVKVQVWSQSTTEDPPTQIVPFSIQDSGDGTYNITYTPTRAGDHFVEIKIFDRPIKGSPLQVGVDPHNNPVSILGHRSAASSISTLSRYQNLPMSAVMNDDWSFNQPVRVCTIERQLLVLDAGNNRVKIFEESSDLTGSDEHSRDLENAPPSFAQSMPFKLKKVVTGEPLAFQSTVGLAKTPQKTFVTLNWRTKCITEWSLNDDALPNGTNDMSFTELKSFTFSEFVEPLDVAVDSEGRVLVCDNGAKKVFVFDHNARPQFSFTVKSSLEMDAANNVSESVAITNSTVGGGKVQQRRRRGSNDEKSDQPSYVTNPPTSFTLGANGKVVSAMLPQATSRRVISTQNMQLSCIAIGPNDDIIVGGSEIQIYDHCGRYMANLLPYVANNTASLPVKMSASSGFFVGGLAVDNDGYVLATVSDSKGGHIAVCRCLSSVEKTANASPARYAIDSSAAKLRRPSGICVASANFCFVADLGNNCIKKYRYK